jgi:sugar phosphate permease
MLLGLILMAIGYVISSTTNSMFLFLIAFGLIVGLGSTLLGTLPSTNLVYNWFDDRRGMAIGLLSIPLVVVEAAPPLLNMAIDTFQCRQSLMGLGLGSLMLLPIILMVVNHSRDCRQSPHTLPRNDHDSINAIEAQIH